jgi:hypothetical protein
MLAADTRRVSLCSRFRLAFIAVATLVPPAWVALAPSSAASTPVPAGTEYAVSEPVCPVNPGVGRSTCFALRRVRVSKGTPGAKPFKFGAGSYAVGPADGLTPGDLATAYNFSPTGSGAGQTVALVDAYNDPNINADLQTFDSEYGLSTCSTSNGCLRVFNQTGGSTLPADDTTGWSVEESLDVETIHSVCENCNIILVEANSNSSADLGIAEDEAVGLGATEISNSYGSPESTDYEAEYDHPGLVITASTGDDGYYSFDLLSGTNAPNTPASYPSVVAVGGTSLYLNSDGTRGSETVWDDDGPEYAKNNANYQPGATGGGCSHLFAAPSWQSSVSDWASTGCGSYRLDGDVAALGDPLTGFDVYDSYACAQCTTGWQTLGGTSLASPIIAAMYALAGGAHGVNYPAQTLYAHLGTSSLYDVTQGGNGWCGGDSPSTCEANDETYYGFQNPNTYYSQIVDCLWDISGNPTTGDVACDAGPGYDGPSGVGTPNSLGAFMPPSVTSISPDAGPLTGGTTVTITGAGFSTVSGATAVYFGSSAASGVSCSSSNSCTATSPAGTGAVDVTVTVGGETSATSSADKFAYTAGPSVTSISPSSGPLAGGTTVNITGTNLSGATSVDFGATAATSTTNNSSTSLTAVSPAEAAGTVNITVITPGGTSANSPSDQFAYVAAPTVTSLSPSAGPDAGGTTVTITGIHLSGATLVKFGGSLAGGFTVVSDTQITAVSPAEPSGPVQVTVTTVGGTSVGLSTDLFTYDAPPTVTRVAPASGPLTGGISVDIAGTYFTNPSTVDFGTSPATSVTYNSSTSLTAVSPAETAGTVDIQVSTPGGASPTSSADQFTYTTLPTVLGVSPTSGSTSGGTAVTISGFNLNGATQVNFGPSITATSFTVVSSGEVNAVSPSEGAGTVDITVTTPNGKSTPTSADHFTFVAPAPTGGGGGTGGGGAPPGGEQTATTTTLKASPNPAALGQLVTYTATVSPGPGAGTIAFTDNDQAISGCASVSFSTSTNTVTCQVTYSSAGSHSIVATYSGDASFLGSTSNSFGEIVQAGGGGTTTSTTTGTTPTTTTKTATPPGVTTPTWARGSYWPPHTTTLSSGGGSLTYKARAGTATVSVPKGALPDGTILEVAPLRFPAAIKHKLPAGQSYLISFAVSWKAPDGTSPKAHKAITLTIVDTRMKAGDTIYLMTPSGLKAVGIAHANGKVTVTFTSDQDLVVANTPRLVGVAPQGTLRGKAVLVNLRCGPAAQCHGVGALVAIGAHGALLAQAGFVIPAGRAKTISLTETAAGHKLLPSKDRASARLTLKLVGGGKTIKVITLP